MSLYPYTITTIAKNTTAGSNIVAGAVVSLLNSIGSPVTMYDNSAGSNGSTGKTADSRGQVTVYVEQGEYSLNVNGTASGKFTVISNLSTINVDTFANLELLTSTTTGQAFICQERANAKYILKESGYVALAGDATFANGRVASLQEMNSFITSKMLDINNEGTIDATAGLLSLFTLAGNIRITKGTYAIAAAGVDAGGVYATITKSINVICDPDVIFVAGDLDNDMIRISVPSDGTGLTDKITMHWTGGKFNQEAQKNSTIVPFSSQYPPANLGTTVTSDGLSFYGDYNDGSQKNGATLISVTNVEFYAGAHWQTAGGDSGLYITGCERQVTDKIKATGSRDCGIYPSSDNLGGLGNSISSTNGEFINCMHGIAPKRSHHGVYIQKNKFTNCVRGTSVELIAGSGAKSVNINNNEATQVSNFVRADSTQGLASSENNIYNLGALLANGDLFTAITNSGYDIAGGSGTTIDKNKFFGVNSEIAVQQSGFGGNAVEIKELSSVKNIKPVISNNEMYDYTTFLRLKATDAALSDNYKFGGAATVVTDFGDGTTIVNTKRPEFSSTAPSSADGKIKIQINEIEYYIAVTSI